MTVFRIHIRPKGGLANSKNSFSYCLKESVLGMGWQANTQNNNFTLSEYLSEARKNYKNKSLSSVKYLEKNVKIDDLIWTRDTNGAYYLGKVKSKWEYYSNNEAQDADIVNIVRCDLIKIPSVDCVPGKVVASFRAPRTIQAIRDKTTSSYSKYLWNKISLSSFYSLPKENFKNVFSFLSAEETEDVIFIYLQLKGWVVIPNSRKTDTMKYEFYLINKTTKEKSIVQVKTGHTKLIPKEWENWKEKVFLFQANDNYVGVSLNKNVTSIKSKDIRLFMYSNKELLPSNIVHWLDVANGK
jgi:hypothetical protein